MTGPSQAEFDEIGLKSCRPRVGGCAGELNLRGRAQAGRLERMYQRLLERAAGAASEMSAASGSGSVSAGRDGAALFDTYIAHNSHPELASTCRRCVANP
jgi:hypothetical protein